MLLILFVSLFAAEVFVLPEIKSRIGNIINGLGIDMSENRQLNQLSSGQRAKVFLGKMLLEEKDIILLAPGLNLKLVFSLIL